MPDQTLRELPQDVDLNNVDDILDCILIEESEFFSTFCLQTEEDPEVHFTFDIKRSDGTQETAKLIRLYSEIS